SWNSVSWNSVSWNSVSWNSTYWEGSPVTDFPAVNEETVVGEETASDPVGFVDVALTTPTFPIDPNAWNFDVDDFVLDPSLLITDGTYDISFDPTVTLDLGNLGSVTAAAMASSPQPSSADQPAQAEAASAPLRNQLFLPLIQR
ncbi:MAG: hypothetical protein KDE31_21595, partial [Caldilineaceae bacterium]|nr:hypothetical protein [Caldilineaceae bacterium]